VEVFMRALALTALVTVAFAFAGCQKSHPNVKEMTITDATSAQKSGGTVFVDANDDDYRKANGKVPGAILLANYREYDPKAVLPESKDAPLVFYCSNKL
jgi:hypothetical protein